MSSINPISNKLREDTRDLHLVAERSPFMQAFFRGQVSREVYCQMLARLQQVYALIEKYQTQNADHPILGKMYFPELFRVEAMQQDLAFFKHMADNKSEMTEATKNYADRIEWLATHWPVGIIAHQYTRYLGDLSGGQMIKKVVKRAYNLENENGVSFYNFSGVPDIPVFKERYRTAIDSLPMDEDEKQRLVDEANLSFRYNIALFHELEHEVKAATL